MAKRTSEELRKELEKFEFRLREAKLNKKASMATHKDEIGDINDNINAVLDELKENQVG